MATPTSRQTALWTQSRGGGGGSELRNVRTYRIDGLYGGGPDGPVGTTSFRPLDMPSTLPLTQVQWQPDNATKKQQSLLGKTACAVSKGLELMEAPIASLTQLADTLPADTRDKVLDEVEKLQAEALAPMGHAMRFLASGYNELSFKRRDAVVAVVKDPVLQQRIKHLGIDTFFREDMTRDIDSALNRQQQNALTAAIRHKPASSSSTKAREPRHRPRSRSPVRRDRDQRRRPFGRGSSRGGGASRGGRSNSSRSRRY